MITFERLPDEIISLAVQQMSFAAKKHFSLVSKRMNAISRAALFASIDASDWEVARFDGFLAEVRFDALQAVSHITIGFDFSSVDDDHVHAAEQKGLRGRMLVAQAHPKSLALNFKLPECLPQEQTVVTHTAKTADISRFCRETLSFVDPQSAVHVHLCLPRKPDIAACAVLLEQLAAMIGERQILRWALTGDWRTDNAARRALFAQAANLVVRTRPLSLELTTRQGISGSMVSYFGDSTTSIDDAGDGHLDSSLAGKLGSHPKSTIRELHLNNFLQDQIPLPVVHFPSLRSLSIGISQQDVLERFVAPNLQNSSLIVGRTSTGAPTAFSPPTRAFRIWRFVLL